MTKLTYDIITRTGITYNADTYAMAQRIKGDNPGSIIKRCYSPIPEKSNLFDKIKRVKAGK